MVGATQQFTANPSANTEWLVAAGGAGGTIDIDTGLYRAPATRGTDTVRVQTRNLVKRGLATVRVVAHPVAPVITAPAAVTTGRTGYEASVPDQPDMTFTWTISNGTITSGDGTSVITFTAGFVGDTQLGCLVTSPAGETSGPTAVTIPVVAAPIQPVITTVANMSETTTETARIDAQPAGISIIWSITAGGSITSGEQSPNITYTAGPVSSVRLTVAVSNVAGDSLTDSVAVNVFPLPDTPIITTPAFVTTGRSNLTASIQPPHATAQIAWTITGGTFTSATNIPQVTYTAGAVGTLVLGVTVTNGAGVTGTGSLSIDVVPAVLQPSITTVANTSEGVATNASIASQPVGIALNWSISSGGTITSGSQGTDVIFTASGVSTVTLTVVASNAAGDSKTDSKVINVFPLPAAPVITAATTVTTGKTGLQASIPAPRANETIQWTISGGNITTVATGRIISYTAGPVGTAVLTVQVTNGAGASATDTENVTVVPAPVTPTITAPADISEDAVVNASVPAQTGITFTWSITSGGSITSSTQGDSITFTASAVASVTLSAVGANAAGDSAAAATATVNVWPLPVTPVISTAATVTAGRTIAASIPAPRASETILWTITGGNIASSATVADITYTAPVGTAALTVTVTNRAGATASDNQSITVAPAPVTPIITTDPDMTEGTSEPASVAAQTGITFNWGITAGGAITTSTEGTGINYTATAVTSVTLTVVASNAANDTATATAVVNVWPVPVTPVINTAATVTTGRSIAASIPAPRATETIQWTLSGGNITAGATAADMTYTAGAPGTAVMGVTVTNRAGMAVPDARNIAIAPAPVTPTITTPADISHGASVTASVGAQSGITFNWSITAGGNITSGTQGTSINYTVASASSVTLTVVASNAATDSAPPATKLVNAWPLPQTPVITTAATVTTGSTGIAASIAAPRAEETITWTITGGTITSPNGQANITYTAGPVGTVVLGVTVRNRATSSASDSNNIAVAPVPITPTITAVNNMTHNTGATASVAPQTGITFTWSITAGGSITPPNTGTSIAFSVATPSSVTLSVVASNAAGETATAAQKTIGVYPLPVVPVISTLSPVTAGRTALTASIPTPRPSETIAWTITGGNITSATDAAQVTYTAGGTGTLTLTVTVTSVAMATETDSEDVTVRTQGVELLAGLEGGPGDGNGTIGQARLRGPTGVAEDAAGNIYVADTENHTIRRVTPAGVTTLYSGRAGEPGIADGTPANARFNRPTGLAIDAAGVLYVADSGSHTIRQVATDGSVVTIAGMAGIAGTLNGPSLSSQFNSPAGLVVDAAGDIFVADTGNHVIRKISGGFVTTWAGGMGVPGSVDNATGLNARFRAPEGITLMAGVLYVADTGNHTIRSVGTTGSAPVNTIAGAAGSPGAIDGNSNSSRLNTPRSTTNDGTLVYFADTGNHTIRRLTTSGNPTTLTIAGTAPLAGSTDAVGTAARFNRPAGVAIRSGSTTLRIADNANHTLRSMSLATSAVTTLAGKVANPGFVNATGTAARLRAPEGVVVSSSGVIYVADAANHAIRRVTMDGVVTTLAGSGSPGAGDGSGTGASFNNPRGLAIDSAGDLYVADTGNHTIRKVTSTGTVTTFAGLGGSPGTANGTTAVARFTAPTRVLVDGTKIYVADTGNHVIRLIEGGNVSTFAGSMGTAGAQNGLAGAALFNTPQGLALDGAGGVLVADSGNHAIRLISGGTVTTAIGALEVPGSSDGSATTARFTLPRDIARGRNGGYWIADTGNALVRSVTSDFTVSTAAGVSGSRGVLASSFPGRFNDVRALAFTPTADVVVTDSSENVVILLRVFD